MNLTVVALLAVSSLFVFSQTSHASLVANESLRLNFTDGFNDGANNFNFVTVANSGIAAGSVIKSDGTTATGVSVDTAGFANENFVGGTPGVFPGTGQNLPDVAVTGNAGTFTNQVTNFFFNSGANPSGSLTISGLDDNLVYDLFVYASVASAGTQTEVATVSVNGGPGIASTRAANTNSVIAPNFTNYVFQDVQLNNSGDLVVELNSSINNGLFNAAIVVAKAPIIPEPSTFALGALGVLGMAKRRRRAA